MNTRALPDVEHPSWKDRWRRWSDGAGSRKTAWKRAWWPEPVAAREMWEQLLFSRLTLIAVGWVALGLLPTQYVSPNFNISTFPPVMMWIRWDAVWYITIALHGYSSSQTLAFFPLYPMAIAGVHFVTRLPIAISALVASNLALIGAAAVFWLLMREYFPKAVAGRALAMFLLFPTAYYMSAAYTESLFLLTTLATFLLAKRGRLWEAGVAGALAALTRNQGVLTAVAILFAYVDRYGGWRFGGPRTVAEAGTSFIRRHWNRLWDTVGWNWCHWEILSVLVPFMGLGAFMYWQWTAFHSPLAFLSAQAYWGRFTAWPWVGIWAAIARVWNGSPLQPAAVLSMIDLSFTVAFFALWWVGRKQGLPLSWLIYWGLLWLIDVSAPDLSGESPLLSMSRLVLVIFPVFATLGMLTERPGWNRLLRWLFPMLQATFFVVFATWHWIA